MHCRTPIDLDSNFLAKLLIKHSSGLSVLAAPDRYTSVQASDEAVEKLLAVARQDFDYVVVDAGSNPGAVARSSSKRRHGLPGRPGQHPELRN